MTRTVTLLQGEGIGPEVMAVALRVVEAVTTKIKFETYPIGVSAWEETGSPLPEDTLRSVLRNRVALKGPVATPRSRDAYRSVNILMRQPLGLLAQLRPVRSWPGLTTPAGIDLVVAREITEDYLAGIEFAATTPAARAMTELIEKEAGHQMDPTAAISVKTISEHATRRFFTLLFEWARKSGRRRITVAHKATVQRATDGLFLEVARDVAAIVSHSSAEIELDDCLVDTLAANLARQPARYDVIAASALYGDILSDLAGAITGGLGLGPGVNFGDDVAVFETAHGTAPRLAGLDRANPTATVLCAAMMLEHLGEATAASSIRRAVGEVLATSSRLTYDLESLRPCAIVGTAEFGDLLVEQLLSGDELRRDIRQAGDEE